MLRRICIFIFTNKLLASFISQCIFFKRNIKTRCVILIILSRYNDTRDVERTLEKLVKHWAIASCVTSFSRVLSTPSCRYNSIKSRDSLIYFLNTEPSHNRETPPVLIRTFIYNLKWQLSSRQRVSELHCLSFIQNFLHSIIHMN